MIANTPFVELRDVSFRYRGSGATVALLGTSFSVGPGEFATVVGPSGCGKSTLMKLVTGLNPATRGQVLVSDRVVDRPMSIVGMAFQNSSLLPWRTALENVLLPLQVAPPYRRQFRKRRREFEERAMELLRLVGLADFVHQHPWELSGGMQHRVSLCRALIHEPSLLMLDEPFAALDAFTKEDLWDVLQHLWMKSKATIIMVTHDLREAVFLSDRVFVMSNRPGRIIHQSRIDLPRPRRLEMTYDSRFVTWMHELRDYIGQARS